MEEILTRYGLLALFVLPAVEGDVTLILAGVVSHLGIFQTLRRDLRRDCRSIRWRLYVLGRALQIDINSSELALSPNGWWGGRATGAAVRDLGDYCRTFGLRHSHRLGIVLGHSTTALCPVCRP
jgi:hypothetical protein